ncbi:hypothetical protein MW887_002385 [Aspergillus wentii]|nr:hypothetical protein MW887_002385 [Aspergillus wentii]
MILPRTDDDGIDRGQRALVVTAVLTSLAIVVVAMRLYARLGLMKIMGREDGSILIALVFSIVYLGLVCAEVHFGLGRHSNAISHVDLMHQLKSLWAAIPMYNASLAFSKFSILFQYLRIFPGRKFRFACYFMMAVVATYSTWAIVSGYVNCVPVAKFWDKDISGHCLSFEAVWFFNASMNIVTDTALMILPMPLLSQLQLPRVQKFALMGVFAVGVVVVITSILRLSSLRVVAQSTDTSWSNVGAAYWTAAECNVAIICACLPFLRPLISRIFPKLLSTNSYQRHTAGPTTTMASRSQKRHPELFSANREFGNQEFGMCSIHAKSDSHDHGNIAGIEVTTEMIQETEKPGETSSERRLVINPA